MPTPLPVRVLVWLWLLAAIYAGHEQALAGASAANFALAIGLPALLVILGYVKIRSVRSWLDALDLRALVFLHTTRLLGIFFLVLEERGELPGQFALPVGWGEILVAAAALVLAIVPLSPGRRLRAMATWNVVGFFGALFALGNAARVAAAGEPQMSAFTALPLSLIPTFIAPLVLATHVIIHLRLRRETAAREPAG